MSDRDLFYQTTAYDLTVKLGKDQAIAFCIEKMKSYQDEIKNMKIYDPDIVTAMDNATNSWGSILSVLSEKNTATFPCTMCGCCCKRVGNIVHNFGLKEKKDNPYYFPYDYDEKGVCEKLGSDNKCTVYDSRPLLCNIDAIVEFQMVDKKKFYMQNALACNKMMDEDNVPMDFRIDINKIQ